MLKMFFLSMFFHFIEYITNDLHFINFFKTLSYNFNVEFFKKLKIFFVLQEILVFLSFFFLIKKILNLYYYFLYY